MYLVVYSCTHDREYHFRQCCLTYNWLTSTTLVGPMSWSQEQYCYSMFLIFSRLISMRILNYPLLAADFVALSKWSYKILVDYSKSPNEEIKICADTTHCTSYLVMNWIIQWIIYSTDINGLPLTFGKPIIWHDERALSNCF